MKRTGVYKMFQILFISVLFFFNFLRAFAAHNRRSNEVGHILYGLGQPSTHDYKAKEAVNKLTHYNSL